MLGFLEMTQKYAGNVFEFGEIVDLEYVSNGEEKPTPVAEDDPEAPTEEGWGREGNYSHRSKN